MFFIGTTTVQKIHEMDCGGMKLDELLPAMGVHFARLHPDWIPDGTMDEGGHAMMSVHAWLVRHEGMTILIDSGAGNGKPRPRESFLDHLDNPFPERLAEAGVAPDDVDVVIHTHLHSDRVGWNTVLIDGEWRPTFPRATTICSDIEWAYAEALADGDEAQLAAARRRAGRGFPVRVPAPEKFADSLRPLEATGRVRRVTVDGREILPGISLVPTPGHSIDHAAVEIRSGTEVALFCGDAMHHPLEIYAPLLVSNYCEFPDVARISRRRLLERATDPRVTLFSAHFPLSSAGWVTARDDGFVWRFASD